MITDNYLKLKWRRYHNEVPPNPQAPLRRGAVDIRGSSKGGQMKSVKKEGTFLVIDGKHYQVDPYMDGDVEEIA